MDDSTNNQATNIGAQDQGAGYNNPDGCSLCSCKGYVQSQGNVCTCGHNSEKHTGNNA